MQQFVPMARQVKQTSGVYSNELVNKQYSCEGGVAITGCEDDRCISGVLFWSLERLSQRMRSLTHTLSCSHSPFMLSQRIQKESLGN